jgi:hypothetical protein
VAIEGFYQAWPRNRKFRGFAPLKMAFGDAIFPPPESRASEEAYEKLTAILKARIVELWEELRRANDAPGSGADPRGRSAEGGGDEVPAPFEKN